MVRCAVTVAVAAVGLLDPWGLTPFGPAKWAAVSISIGAAALFVFGGTPIRAVRSSTIGWIAFLLAAALAAARGADPLYAWIGTPERHFGWLTWVLCALSFVVGQQLRPAEVRSLVAALAALGGVAGCWTIGELAGWDPFALTNAGRPIGVMGSSAFLGALTTMTTPVALGAALDPTWRRGQRIGLAVAGASSAVALVASGARAAWIGAAISLAVVTVCRRRSLRARTVTWGAVAVVVGTFVISVGLAAGVAGRLSNAFTEFDGGARGRADEWRTAVRVIAGHPLTGVGPEGYRLAFASAVDVEYEQRHGRDPLPDRAHNSVLDVAATTGVPGAVLFLLVVASVGRFLVRAIGGSAPMVGGVSAGVLAYALQSLFLFPLAELDPVVWLAAGAAVGAVAKGHEIANFFPAVGVRHLLAAVTLFASVVGVLDVAADRAARRVLDEMADGHSPSDPDGAARLRPDAVRYHLVAARGYEESAEVGSFAAVLRHLDAAARLSPHDPVVRRDRARILLERARTTTAPDDIARAVSTLRSSAHDDPINAEVQLRLGLALALAGDHGAAERAWVKAERLAPTSSSAATNLAIAYARQGRIDDARRAAERAIDVADGADGT